jgi:hypothetical protein
MIATLWSVPHGPWPGQDGIDTEGFRSAVDILSVVERRVRAGEAGSDDRTRYRLACATVERGARKIGTRLARIDAGDLLAWMGGTLSTNVHPPERVATFMAETTGALDGSGALGVEFARACRAVIAARSGLVITLDPGVDFGRGVVRAASRPDRPIAARNITPDPDLAAALAELPRTADAVFAEDPRRLQMTDILRQQIMTAISTGEPLAIGSQAKHDVLTEVLRELHHHSGSAGLLRIMYATEASEAQPFEFRPLPVSGPHDGETVHLGLMSIRHTDLDADVAGYWFRNRLVSVPGRSQAEADAYCYRDSVPRLHALIDRGVTDIVLTHTGYEPAAIGFYRAVAQVTAARPLRIHPRYLARNGVRNGTPWPQIGNL